MEQRRGTRYPVKAPAFYCWECAEGILQEAHGITHDISDRGVFVLAKELPPVGKCVELDIHLPTFGGSARAAQLHGEGTVVRTTARGATESGFAASVLFQTGSPDPASDFDSRTIH